MKMFQAGQRTDRWPLAARIPVLSILSQFSDCILLPLHTKDSQTGLLALVARHETEATGH